MGKKFLEFKEDFSYEKALHHQTVLYEEGYSGLLGFTPSPTITLGIGSKGASEINVSRDFLEDRKIEVLALDRGGKATFHGPGQLVGFPIINLKAVYNDARAVRRFSEDILLGLAHACAAMGVRSVETRQDLPGVWTARGKIASVGITVKNGFVFHGFSLNLSSECYSGFQLIDPCGISNCALTSLEEEGIKEAQNEEKILREIAPYLHPLFDERVSIESPSIKYDRNFDTVQSRFSKSSVALDYIYSSLSSRESIRRDS